ncbi:hypothetical protein BP6252_06445 [Coleophoma cylindrospora]|uniref:Phytocyanin domain-containing protein n=1 Tax=Coleophoma cylindrospora TaxID=1849047 RepID=A0A3D8RMN7_9HELO|nr:hypothetical protein BP6252_06445 [Coleophoma cylindrospora]
MFRPLISMLAVAAAAQAATIDIAVGETGLKFTPNTTTAAVGDVLAFHFYSGGHSVVSGALANPCTPDATSFFSGYIPGSSAGDTTFEVTVNSTDPIWFYCSLNRHCENGMVGVVNPPTDTSLSAYASAAAAVKAASAPANPVGGVLTTEAASSTGSAGASSTTGSTTTTATGASKTTASGTSSTASSASATATKNAAMNVFGEVGSLLGVGVAAGFIAMVM